MNSDNFMTINRQIGELLSDSQWQNKFSMKKDNKSGDDVFEASEFVSVLKEYSKERMGKLDILFVLVTLPPVTLVK